MRNTTALNHGALNLALFFTFAVPAFAGFIIPSAEWGPGLGSVNLTVYNYSGPSGCALTASASTCSLTIASNQPPDFLNSPNGAATGTVSASTDSLGAHLYTETGVSGYSSTTVTGKASFSDTVYNPTGSAAKVQFTFHLDATLFTRSSAGDFLQLDFNQGTLFQTQLGYGAAGTYSYVNQDITTPVLTVAANSLTNWSLVLSATLGADSSAGAQYLAGTPTGFVDAGNTLSFTGISVTDAAGNPLDTSGLTSYAGFDYTHSATSSVSPVPEPATMSLAAGACVLFALLGKRKASGYPTPTTRT